MILRLFKPSWRKLLITVGLYLMAGFSSGLDKAILEATRQDLAASVIGQSYKEELKRIYQEVRCEANEQAREAAEQFLERVQDQDKTVSLERRASILRWMGAAVMVIFCYLLACVACTGAVIRLREKA